jgi:hypothetical protein
MSQNEETITVLPSQPATTVQLEMAALQITSRTKQVRSSFSGSKAIRFLEVLEEARVLTIAHHRSIGKEGMHLVGSLDHNDDLRVHVVSLRFDTHGHVGRRLQFPHISVR